MFSSNQTKVVAAGAAAVAVAIAIGGFAIGNSSSSSDESGTAYAAEATAPSQTPESGQVPEGWSPGMGTIITGAEADKAEAAALTADYPGTVNRVVKLSDGSYSVHLFETSGVHHVFVNEDFEVTGVA